MCKKYKIEIVFILKIHTVVKKIMKKTKNLLQIIFYDLIRVIVYQAANMEKDT